MLTLTLFVKVLEDFRRKAEQAANHTTK